MLRLINVKRNNNIIEANYIPEGIDELGFIKIDLDSEEIIDNKDTSYDFPYQTFLIHAASALKAIANDKPFKDEYTHMWY